MEISIQPDLLQSVRLDVLVLPKRISKRRSHGIEISMAFTYADAEKAFPQTIASFPYDDRKDLRKRPCRFPAKTVIREMSIGHRSISWVDPPLLRVQYTLNHSFFPCRRIRCLVIRKPGSLVSECRCNQLPPHCRVP